MQINDAPIEDLGAHYLKHYMPVVMWLARFPDRLSVFHIHDRASYNNIKRWGDTWADIFLIAKDALDKQT